MADRIERGEFAGPMLRILWQSLHAFVDENGRRFDFAQDMPDILEEARTTRWAELTAEATNKPLMLNFEAGGDDGCQEELVDALSTLLEKTDDESNWVTRKEIYHRIYSYDSGLWSKMEHIEFQDSTDFKKVRAPSCLLLHPHTTNPNPPHSISLFRHMLRLKARSWRWIWPSSTTGKQDSRARDLMILL